MWSLSRTADILHHLVAEWLSCPSVCELEWDCGYSLHEGQTLNLHKGGTSDGVGPWKITGTEDPGLGTEGGGCM